MLSEKKLFLFDIDGTVALGDVLLPGAAEFFQEIKERGGQFVFITNNSTKSIADYIKKFRQMGVSTDPQNFELPPPLLPAGCGNTQLERLSIHLEHDH